jgi:hypothetical protein
MHWGCKVEFNKATGVLTRKNIPEMDLGLEGTKIGTSRYKYWSVYLASEQNINAEIGFTFETLSLAEQLFHLMSIELSPNTKRVREANEIDESSRVRNSDRKSPMGYGTNDVIEIGDIEEIEEKKRFSSCHP